MILLNPRLIISVLAIIGSAPCTAAQELRVYNPDRITLYVPAFFSEPKPLGLNVASVLGLQVWQTLRRAPSPNPKNHDFGEGVVRWTPSELSAFGFDSADKDAQRFDILAQLILWGKAYQYGSGIVVFAHLSIPDYSDFRFKQFERWRIAFKLPSGRTSEVTADLPSRRYTFEPLVLRAEIAAQFSRPDALPLYSDSRGRNRIGTLPPVFDADNQTNNAVHVVTRAGQGWVILPGLSNERSEVVELVAAIVRLFRGDWAGARDLLRRALATAAPTAVRVDTYLLSAYAGVRLGAKDVEEDLHAAEVLNPNAKRVIVFRTMYQLDLLARASEGRRRELARALQDDLDRSRVYFDESDPWFLSCSALLREFR
jgi:hypothetical protein